jgi:hypothetical protein
MTARPHNNPGSKGRSGRGRGGGVAWGRCACDASPGVRWRTNCSRCGQSKCWVASAYYTTAPSLDTGMPRALPITHTCSHHKPAHTGTDLVAGDGGVRVQNKSPLLVASAVKHGQHALYDKEVADGGGGEWDKHVAPVKACDGEKQHLREGRKEKHTRRQIAAESGGAARERGVKCPAGAQTTRLT